MKPLDELPRTLSRRVVAPATLVALLGASAGAGALLALTAPPPDQGRGAAPVEAVEQVSSDPAGWGRPPCAGPADPAGRSQS